MKAGYLFVLLLIAILGYLVYRLYQKPEVVIVREVDYRWNPWDYGNWFGGPGIYWKSWGGYDSIRPTHRPLPRPSGPPRPGPHPRPGPSPPRPGSSPSPHSGPRSPPGPPGSPHSPQ
jgi:hypothetical protein